MGKKVQEMLDNANQRVPKVEVNQAMEWMNDGNTVFVDVRSKDAVRDSGLVRGAVHAERGMIEFFADQEHALGKPELKPAKRVVLYCAAGGQAALAGATLLARAAPCRSLVDSSGLELNVSPVPVVGALGGGA